MSESLAGRRVLITGGSRGIGRCITLDLVRRGATVAFSYLRNGDAAEEKLRELLDVEDLGDVPESAEEKFHGQKVSQSAFDATTKANQTQLQPHHVEAAKIHDAATEATAESKPMLSAAHSQLASYHRAEAGKITGDEDQTKPGTNDVSDPNNAGRDGKALKEGQPDHESAFAKLSASIQKKEGYSKQAADATAASIGQIGRAHV